MAGIIEKNVFRFQVTVNNVETVQTLKRTQQLRGIETGSIDIESLFFLQMVEQLTTIDEGQDEVQFFRGLEGKLEGNNERVVDL